MIFELSNVSFRYPGAKKFVFENLTLSFPKGKTTALMGPSGVGKTTLLYLLGLLWDEQPLDVSDAKSIPIRDGVCRCEKFLYYGSGETPLSYRQLSGKERTELRSKDFGFVLQSGLMLGNFSCIDNVAFPLALQGRDAKARRKLAEELIDEVNDRELKERQDHLPSKVSGGQRQRFAVLRAIIHQPRVLFADEPFSQLDPENAGHILDLLGRWQRNELYPGSDPRTVILVCHHEETARTRAQHLIKFSEGESPRSEDLFE